LLFVGRANILYQEQRVKSSYNKAKKLRFGRLLGYYSTYPFGLSLVLIGYA